MITINEAMVLTKTIRERMNALTILRNANAVEKRTYFLRDDGGEKQREEITPKYDPRLLDKKITELEGILFKIETAIKRANAKTEIGVEVNIDQILAPIE